MSPRTKQQIHEHKIAKQDLVKKIQENSKKDLLPELKKKMEETSELILKEIGNSGEKGLNNIQIMSLIAKGSLRETALGGNIEYTAQEIRAGFDLYLDMIYKINQIKDFPPTIESFMNFMGVSRQEFDKWASDIERKNAAEYISSYLTGVLATGSLTGDLREVSSIYIQKTMGKIEQQAPTIVEHKKITDIDEIKDRINSLKRENIIDADWEEKWNYI